MKFQHLILFSFTLIISIACDGQKVGEIVPYAATHPEQLSDYWYAGEAELNRYTLSQSRYGENREGEAVLVYVTEDFLTNQQVKKEFGNGASTSVLKLNMMKKFITGIYDYSIMTSIFTPMKYMDQPATLKATLTAQDWCGQSFSQMNLRDKTLEYEVRSYFQNPADTNISIPATYVEEDIWTRARIEPQMLPMGEINMVPSQEYLRLKHEDVKPYEAKGVLYLQVNDKGGEENNEIYIYTLTYPDLNRRLTMHIQGKFPYKILMWEETWNTDSNNKQVTRAELTGTQKRKYWQENGIKQETLRDSLGLRMGFK